VRAHPDERARQEELLTQLQRGEIEAFTMDKRDVPSDGETVGVRLIRRIFTGPDRGRQAERAGRHHGTQAAGRGSAGGGGGGQFGHEPVSRGDEPRNRPADERRDRTTSGLSGSALQPEPRDKGDTIRHGGDLRLVITDLRRGFLKIESGRPALEQAEYAVREWVEGALDLRGPRLAQKGLDLHFEVADGVPGSCETPASDLSQSAGQRGEVCEWGGRWWSRSARSRATAGGSRRSGWRLI
jgi:hypothetical protein